MPIAAGTPDPPALAGSWEEIHEARIRELERKHAGTPHHPLAGVKMRPGGVPAAVQRAAGRLGVAVLSYRPGQIGLVTVQCPHCGGRRSIQAQGFGRWEQLGAVPPCGVVSKTGKPTCEPPGAEGVADAPGR